MLTTFHPAGLGPLALHYAENQFQVRLLKGLQPWDLSNFGPEPPAAPGRGKRHRLQADWRPDAAAFLARPMSILGEHQLQVDVVGRQATISPVVRVVPPYTEAVDADLIPSFPNHQLMYAHQRRVPGWVPIRRCRYLNERTKGGLKSHRILFVVGDRSLGAVPAEWGLSEEYRVRLDALLGRPCWFGKEEDASTHAAILTEAYLFRSLAETDRIPEYAREKDTVVEVVGGDDWMVDFSP